MSTRACLLGLPLLAACAQDSSFTKLADPEPPAVDTSAPPIEVEEEVIPEVDEDCPDYSVGGIVLSVDESCENEPFIGQEYTPVVEWEWQEFPTFPESHGSFYAPVVAHMTDDNRDGLVGDGDIPDVLIGTYDFATYTLFVLRLLSGDGSMEHWSRDHWDVDGTAWFPDSLMSPAVADVDSDGHAEIFLVVHSDPTIVHEWTTCRLARVSSAGELEALSEELPICLPHAPVLTDMTGDGDIEVVVHTTVFSADDLATEASPLTGREGGDARSPTYWNGPIPAVVDLDGDGTQEIATGLHIQEADGTPRCFTDAPYDGWTAVADLNGDGIGEVVITGNGSITIVDHQCRYVASWPLEDSGRGGPATIADYDGDGIPEIGVAGADYYTVFETDGTRRWRFAVADQSSNCTGSSVFDLEGDGFAEVVYADEQSLWIFSGYFGHPVMRYSGHSSATSNEYPIIVDVDGDGSAEVVATHDLGVYALGTEEGWAPTRQLWNQHTYHISNVHDDLTIPTPTPSNWPEYNSFRSADIRTNNGQGARLPDAVPVAPDLCEIDCDEGAVRVTIQLGNIGLADLVEGGSVAVYAEQLDGSRSLVHVLEVGEVVPSGFSVPGVTLELAMTDLPTGTLILVADDDGTGTGAIEECDEDNNELRLEGLCADD